MARWWYANDNAMRCDDISCCNLTICHRHRHRRRSRSFNAATHAPKIRHYNGCICIFNLSGPVSYRSEASGWGQQRAAAATEQVRRAEMSEVSHVEADARRHTATAGLIHLADIAEDGIGYQVARCAYLYAGSSVAREVRIHPGTCKAHM